MADNAPLPLATGSTRNAATDQVTHSGDTADVQLVRVVEVTGAEGSKTVISPNAVISTANSSTALLLLNGTFTGTGEDVTEYSHIVVSVYASHASATDGLQLQQSTNGTNWDWVDNYTVPATTGKSFSAPVQGKFFRVVFTNGGIMQTDFRIATLYSKQTKKGSSVRPQDGRSNDNDFEESLAFGMGFDGTSWNRLRSTVANGLDVNVTRIVAALPTGANVIGGVTGTFFQATQPVSGTFFQATQPVSLATNTPILAAGTAIVGKVGIDQTTPGVTNLVAIQPTTLAATATAAANTAATATLPAVAGQFHYITGIEIMRTSTAALAGTATLVVTSTNLPGSLAWSFGNAMAAGATQRDTTLTFDNPLKSSVVNTATTIVMPAPGAAVLWRANVYYYTAA